MTLDDLAPPVLVQSAEQFAAMLRDLERQSRIAVDTESNSLHAYRERVCLLQFSTPQVDYILDPLAVERLEPLGAIFSSPRIEKIFHASEYDILCLQRDYGFTFCNLFDTMQAGRILGRRQAGLDRLLEDKLGLRINKRFQKADWGARPLPLDLLLYARQDTHYLIRLRDLLQGELEARGLWPLAQEDFRMACQPNGLKPKVETPYWMRYSARRDLSSRDLTILNELFAFREAMAARLDRPPFKVVEDERLIAVARARPSTLAQLKEVGLSSRQLQHWGPQILEAVKRGMKSPPVKPKRQPPPDEAYLRRLDLLKSWRKKAGITMDVESDVILPRALLLALAEGGAGDLRRILECSPWRLEHFGPQILKVLQES